MWYYQRHAGTKKKAIVEQEQHPLSGMYMYYQISVQNGSNSEEPESSVLGIRKKTSRCQEEAARLQEEEKATISDGVVESSTSELVNLPSDHVDNVQSVQNGS